MLYRSVCDTDMLIHYGGDEFLRLGAAHTNLANTIMVAEHVRSVD